MVLKEGGLFSLCTGVPLFSMVGVLMVLKEGGFFLCVPVSVCHMVSVHASIHVSIRFETGG